jgi:hypothetical protein
LGLHTNKTRIKKDDKIGNIMADNWWEGDDNYSWLDDTVGTYSDDDYNFGNDTTNDYGADNYDSSWMDDVDLSSTDWLDTLFDDDATNDYGADDYSWTDDFNFGDELFNTDTSPEGQISSWMDNYFNSGDSNDQYDFSGGLDFGGEETGIFGGTVGPKLSQMFLGDEGGSGILSMLFGGAGSGKKGGGGILGNLIGGSKNMLDNDLIKILLGKKLLDDDRKGGSAAYVPIGQEAYGGGGGQPSYQISNIQPALLPGMAYANQPTTYNADPPPTAPPPGMQGGGLASHNHPQLHSHAHGSRPNDIPGMPGMQDLLLRPDGMQAGGIASLENRMEGPGDITKAMLEPGEFVMTRKATENLTPEYLYNLMNQAENAGRRR